MPDLPKRTLGRTGLRVTTLGFGALELRGMVAGVGAVVAGDVMEARIAGLGTLRVAVR